MFDKYFGLGTAPHWEGHPVIYRRADVLCDESDVGELTAVLARLLEERERRIRPGRDDKVVVDWNGLAVVALCEAGRTLERRDWIEAAGEAYRAIMARRDMQGRLPHAFLGGAAVYPALSSDYAAMIEAAIALSQATQDSGFIDDARRLAALLQEWHGDPDGFMLTASDATDVPMRIRGDVDEAIPSATGQVIESLARLAALTGDVELHERVSNAARHAAGRAATQAYGQAGIVNANAVLLEGRKLVVVADPDCDGLVPVANRTPDPRRVDLVVKPGDVTSSTLPDGSTPPMDRTAAYLCLGQRCLAPISQPEALAAALAEQ